MNHSLIRLLPIPIPQSTEQMMQPEQWTRDILKLMGVVILAATLMISIGNLAGVFNWGDTWPIYAVFGLISLAWWGVNHGGWRWASFFPTAVCFLLGAYGSFTAGFTASMGLYYALAVLLAGMLHSQAFRVVILLASILAYSSLGMLQAQDFSLQNMTAIIPFTFCLTGVSLLQWYFNTRLQRTLAAVISANQALQTESNLRQQAEAVQFEQAIQLRRLADNMTDMVVEMDTAGIMNYVSPSHRSVMGIPPEALAGTVALDLLHPEDIPLALDAMQKAATSRAPTQVQVRARHADGHYLPLEISGTALFDSDEKLSGFIFASRDINERLLAEASRMDSERKYRSIIEATPLGIHMYDLGSNDDLIFSGYNPAANAILGIDHAELLGKTIEEAFPNLAGTPPPEQYRRIAREGGRWKDEQFFYTDNRIHGAYAVNTFQSNPNHVVVMFEDITARIQAAEALQLSEIKFSKAFLTSPDAININRLSDGVYVEINPGFTQLTGYTYEESIGKSSLAMSIWADPADRVRLVQGLREKGVVDNLEARFRRKNGDVSTGLMSARVIEINGETCILSITRDISERQQAEQDLRAAHQELAQAYEATLQGWVRALEMRERETAHHSRRVVELTTQMAQALGISGEELVHIQRGALLHDIGKMGVPDNILRKPDALTPDEWVIMRQHPQFAVALLQEINYLRRPMEIPSYHHEKWNGNGYPRGLCGEEIPLGARIFAIADVYDALTSDRPYRPAWTKKDSLRYIVQQKGIHFDPALVDLFLKIIDPSD